MASWILTQSLTALRSAINTICPGRDKTSDGSIGDPAHAQGTSGHNPDDTPGVKAEFSDADNIAEVRAIDVDDDTRSPITMLDIIEAILASPACRNRLKYIIYNRVIWSASNNWQPREYTGPNPHTTHCHFSGNPADDANGAPWTAVLALGVSMAVTPTEVETIAQASGKEILDDRKWADYVPNADGIRALTTLPTAVFLARKDSYEGSNKGTAALGKLDQLLARPSGAEAVVDQAQVNLAVRLALTDPEVVGPLASAVADEIWRRMAPGV